jgi:hypothetical protein
VSVEHLQLERRARLIAGLIREGGEGTLLEFVRAAIPAAALASGVDMLRTHPSETSMLQGRIGTHQIWRSANFTSDPPTIHHVALHVDDVKLVLPPGHRRMESLRLVKPGSVVRALLRDPKATELSVANLEIFGWEVLAQDLPAVEEAMLLLETP